MNGPFMLLIDDSVEDLELATLATQQLSEPLILHTCHSGPSALSWLLARADTRLTLPDVIVLDWKMPGMGGRDVLGLLKASPELRHLPVVVFSTSQEAGDQQLARQLGAQGFLQKPAGFDQLGRVLLGIGQGARNSSAGEPSSSWDQT